ncbi:methyltransferase [Chloropicon primus]|uniref:Methyltransferase n=2 Tax=Chloropicon primus TaxID=1764295 RepID=A0A5B8MQF3_9CHLO|nr:methyltransferase [Chloropicon primus]|eukprot:QDZ22591.1 methyltransferase [Chloropicon primus]
MKCRGLKRDVYTHGHHASVVSQHAGRTAQNSAAFLLPRLRDGLTVLDVGCGPGTISVGLAQSVGPRGKLVAVDAAEAAVSLAKEAARKSAVGNMEVRVASAYDLPYGDDTFDVAFAHQTLQHLSDPVEALRELKRVVKTPGGIVAARDADYASMLSHPVIPGIERWRDVYRQVARANQAEPDAGRHLVAWARQAGWSVEDIEFTTSVKLYSGTVDEGERARWGGDWSRRSLESDFGSQAVEYNIATADEMNAISRAWLEFKDNPESLFYYVNGEVILQN